MKRGRIMNLVWGKLTQNKRWVVLLLVMAIAASAAGVYVKKGKTPASTVTTSVVGRGDVQATISATGTISAVNTVSISSRVTGLISELRVKENDHVKAGQVLVVLDDTSLRAQVAQYQAQMANYAAIYERSKKLTASGGQSVQQMETDRTNYLVAKATYDNFASQLDYYVIKAPIDGIVIGKPTPAGQTVVQGISEAQVLMSVADMSKMEIKVQVDETDIGNVKVGQLVNFTVDAYTDKTFTGKVKSISKDATTTSNVVYYPVYVDIDEPEGLLYPTMTARVTIVTGQSSDVLVVPLSTVKDEKGYKYVQVLVDGQTRNTPVKVGLCNDELAEIIDGLKEGDQVVVPAAKEKTTTTNQQQGPPPM